MQLPRADLATVLSDLRAEHEALDAVVAPLDAADWTLATPAERFTIAHQIAHLGFFDRAAAMAIVAPEDFVAERDTLFAAGMAGPEELDRLTTADLVGLGPAALLAEWRSARAAMLDAAGGLTDGDRVEWYGPSMSAVSFVTARLMETWAHGQDVVDALGDAGREAGRPASDRLRHIAQLGVLTRGWSYGVRGEEPPDAEIRVELDSPDGEVWEWGPSAADDVVAGPAEDFCLVVTQRRHVDDTTLEVRGPAATSWMAVAQAFAGGPTEGPRAGRFA